MCFFVSIIDYYYYIVIIIYIQSIHFLHKVKKYAEIEEVKWWKELLPNWIDHQARQARESVRIWEGDDDGFLFAIKITKDALANKSPLKSKAYY